MEALNKSVIISGEAPETDSEEEETVSINISPGKNPIRGEIVTGEDSESENENDGSISSAVSALNQYDSVQQQTLQDSNANHYKTLLQQKLRESNAHLRNNTELLCDNIINEASKTLNTVDQHLLKSQIVLQGALSSMRSLSASSLNVKNKLHSLLSAKFIPNIKVAHPE